MDKAWKAYERWIAKFFGTTRNPLSGKNAGGDRTGDIIHSTLNIECKNHKSMTVVDWMQKAIKESNKTALLFCHKTRTPYEDTVVCIPFRTFKKIKKYIEDAGFDISD